MNKTLYDKLWQSHKVSDYTDGFDLIYIDKHLVHEVTSPQAFEGLELSNRNLWNLKSILAVPEHNVPTIDRDKENSDKISAKQLQRLDINAKKFKLDYISLADNRQGIVHIIGPEQGFVQPGVTIVCGDSHTATHGALAALGFGIGTSEVEKVFATQCLVLKKSKNYLVQFENTLPQYVAAKDLILAMIRLIGTSGATGHTLEYSGEAITNLSIEERMTVCNMSIEAGARSGLIGVDDKTIEYSLNRPYSPSKQYHEKVIDHWRGLKSDPSATYDKTATIDCSQLQPMVTWGTSPEMSVCVGDSIPEVSSMSDDSKRENYRQALEYMGVSEGQPLDQLIFDKVFIGSCTNSRISDLEVAANFLSSVKGKVHGSIKQAMVVPGSGLVKAEAEKKGLDKIFKEKGFEWREPGCSMCLGMNQDTLKPQERCASTSNRNFEGRQGRGGRTHLMSPLMASVVAIAGTVVHPQEVS